MLHSADLPSVGGQNSAGSKTRAVPPVAEYCITNVESREKS